MACSSDPKKVALWLARFRRLLDSGLTVARFCIVEGVSESSFYYWQKKLRRHAVLGLRAQCRATRTEGRSTGEDDGRSGVGNHGARSENRNVGSDDRNIGTDDGRSGAGNHGARSEDRDVYSDDRDVCSEDRRIFTPVSVVPSAYGVVVRLPGGARIEVGAQHLDAIRAVVAETVRAGHGQSAERNASTGNPAIRKASTNNPVVRVASTDNQSTRKASSGNQNIRRRGGTARTRHGAVSC